MRACIRCMHQGLHQPGSCHRLLPPAQVVLVAEAEAHGEGPSDGPEEREWHLHSVLLAAQSEFFHKALTSGFMEKQERRIRVECASGVARVWPTLVDFFYTDTIEITKVRCFFPPCSPPS